MRGYGEAEIPKSIIDEWPKPKICWHCKQPKGSHCGFTEACLPLGNPNTFFEPMEEIIEPTESQPIACEHEFYNMDDGKGGLAKVCQKCDEKRPIATQGKEEICSCYEDWQLDESGSKLISKKICGKHWRESQSTLDPNDDDDRWIYLTDTQKQWLIDSEKNAERIEELEKEVKQYEEDQEHSVNDLNSSAELIEKQAKRIEELEAERNLAWEKLEFIRKATELENEDGYILKEIDFILEGGRPT